MRSSLSSEQDLKGLLAYSTIGSSVGLITLLIGLDAPLGLVAAIFHIINHATFKASLLMAAGIIDHETGTRDIRRLSGLWRFMPVTATLAMVSAAAMAGVPLLNGFLSKEMFFAETIEIHAIISLVDHQACHTFVHSSPACSPSHTHCASYATCFLVRAPEGLPRTPHEPPFLMRLPAEVLVLACLVVGTAPAFTIGPLLETALRSVLGSAIPEYSLKLWHGFTPELLMSCVAILGGVIVYAMLRSYLLTADGPPLLRRIKSQQIFEQVFVVVSWRFARWLESVIGTRRLQPQLQLMLCAALLAGFIPAYLHGIGPENTARTPFDMVFALIWAVGIACALGAAYQARNSIGSQH